jgi:predicted GTPase
MKIRTIIIGAAGRDFHNFNVLYRNNSTFDVVAFTANQIPFISGRVYPSSLSGSRYPKGIKIYDESLLERLIRKNHVDLCVLAYSDLPYNDVMKKASIVNASGSDFILIAPEKTMLKSKKPIIAVCAVRTGSGKSQTARYIAKLVKQAGKTPVVIRHPMPYGILKDESVERFETMSDLDKNKCTIEEREEYEPHLKNGTVVYAGVDYQKILSEAEKEADIIIWDGGNNDTPFLRPDLMITVADPLRLGNETTYYPGETAARMADLFIINKINSATRESITALRKNLQKINKKAKVVLAESIITTDGTNLIKGKRVLIIEDGPSVTHGGMKFGAAMVAAKMYGAAEIVEARRYAKGSIKQIYLKYQHIERILPAMGYSKKQILELNETINHADCDSVVSATPINLRHILNINKPVANVTYELKPKGDELKKAISKAIKGP